jgi:hypothetical protein
VRVLPVKKELDMSSTVARNAAEVSLKRPNPSIVMRPKFGKLTAETRKLLNVLFYIARKLMSESKDGEYDKNYFECYISEILTLLTPPGEDIYTRTASLKRNLDSLTFVKIMFSLVDVDNGENKDEEINKEILLWSSYVMLSGVEYIKSNGALKVRWSFPHQILESLKEPKRFCQINLAELISMPSYASVALYEICSRYKNSPWGVTSTHSVNWWIDALSGDSGFDSIKEYNKNSPIERMSYKLFRRDYLYKAIECINKFTMFEISLIEIKEGRSIVDLKFEIKVKNTAIDNKPICIAVESSEDVKVINLGLSLGFKEFEIKNYILLYDASFSNLALSRYETRVKAENLPLIENKERYLKKCFEDFPLLSSRSSAEKRIEKNKAVNNEEVSNNSKYKLIYDNMPEEKLQIYKSILLDIYKKKGLPVTPVTIESIDKKYFGSGVHFFNFKNLIDEEYGG